MLGCQHYEMPRSINVGMSRCWDVEAIIVEMSTDETSKCQDISLA